MLITAFGFFLVFVEKKKKEKFRFYLCIELNSDCLNL